VFGARLAKKVVRSFRRHFPGPFIPYVATFTVSAGFRLGRDFSIERYPGLKLCHIVRDPVGPDKVLTYWDDQPHFELYNPDFSRENGLPDPSAAGVLLETYMPRENFFRRYSMKDWILGAAGVIAAMALLHGSVAGLVDPPDAQVTFTDLAPINRTPGQPIDVPVSILNQSAYAPARVISVEAQARSKDGTQTIPLQSDWASIPLIAAGQTTKIQVSGMAPDVTAPHSAPQEYLIEVAVGVRTGSLRGRGIAKPKTLPRFFVWPSDIGWSTRTVGLGKDYCRFAIDLYPGRPFDKGFSGYVQVKSLSKEVTSLNVSESTWEQPESIADSGYVTNVVHFHTSPLEKFKPHTLKVTLESAGELSPLRWGQFRLKIGPDDTGK
jgi:hypothetical protein